MRGGIGRFRLSDMSVAFTVDTAMTRPHYVSIHIAFTAYTWADATERHYSASSWHPTWTNTKTRSRESCHDYMIGKHGVRGR